MTFLTHLDESTIHRLVEGALEEAAASAAKAHIDACARCRRRSAEISALFSALAAAPPALCEPPIDFLAAVMMRVDHEPGLLVHRIRPRVVAGALASGLATALAGGALVVLGGGTGELVPALPLATGLAALFARAGLITAAGKAAAPLFAASAFASAIVLAPLFLRALRAAQPAPARATVRF